ncbi:MAG: glutathione transferase GstA [Gammaproteobacteria bacterium]
MKLYYSPGACSLSPHIALLEAGLPFTLEKVDLRAKTTDSGADYCAVNPKGYVPALELDNGAVLTEGPAIVQYIADQAPASGLAPQAGTLERYQLMGLLNYISVEIHKNYSPLFRPDTHGEVSKATRANLANRYGYLNELLQDREYLLGETFTVADGYLFTVTSWAPHVQFDLASWPNIQAFQQRIAVRPAVQQALRDEGLLR